MRLAAAILLHPWIAGHAADPGTYLTSIAEELKVAWPNNRTVNIVCHGHSVPAGYFKTPLVDTFNAYPHLWHRALKERFPHAVINVINTSIGGESSDRGAARFASEVLTHRPDIVTIDYSLNDRRIGLDAGMQSDALALDALRDGSLKAHKPLHSASVSCCDPVLRDRHLGLKTPCSGPLPASNKCMNHLKKGAVRVI